MMVSVGCAQDDDEGKEEEGQQGHGEQAMAVVEQLVAGAAKKAKKNGQPLAAAAVQVYNFHFLYFL